MATISTGKNKVIEMPANTFKAESFNSPFGSESFKVSGTLDGFIDLAVPQGCTYPLSLDEARLLAATLTDAIHDVELNCLYERDSLLMQLDRRKK